MAKCRGCGDDTRDLYVEGLGWMHAACEADRQRGLAEERVEHRADVALLTETALAEMFKNVIVWNDQRLEWVVDPVTAELKLGGCHADHPRTLLLNALKQIQG